MKNRMTHGRQIKTVFVFLAAMILVSHFSSILLLNGVIETEEEKVRSRLRGAVEGIFQVWAAGGHALESFDSLVAPLLRSGLVAAVWVAESREPTQWFVRRFGQAGVLTPVLGAGDAIDHHRGQFRGGVPFSNAEYRVAGRYYRAISVAHSISGTPVIVGVAAPTPTVARLRAIWRWDLCLRGTILIFFVWFSLQFFRLIFLPYQKMRAQAERLSGAGCLPGPKSDDVEYVMEAFASAVARLTRQKENLQRQYHRSEKRYESLERFNTYILNSMSAGVLILDRGGRVLRLNPSAKRILSLESSEIVGRSYKELGERFSELRTVLSAGLEEAKAYVRREITIELEAEKGGKRYLGITTSLIHDDEERVVGISILLTDLTEIKRLQADLESNRRLADLGEMAAGLAHQLRNSLTAIVGFGRLLRHKISPDDPARNTVGDVLQEAAESEQMLKQFLDFARPLNIVRRRSSLGQIIDKAAEVVRACFKDKDRSVSIEVQKPPGDDFIDADPLLLRQVFVNLFQNAAEAMSEDGRIDVRVLLLVDARDRSGHWMVRVRDSGPGIPGTDYERIFQPFYTSKETGTGLGLPIARKIISCHGGHLNVESSTPAGTVFLLRLPREAASRACEDQHKKPQPVAKWVTAGPTPGKQLTLPHKRR